MDASKKPIFLLFSVQRWLQLVLNMVVAGLVVLVAGVAVVVRSKVNVGAIGIAFLNASTVGAIARIALFERDTPSEQDTPSFAILPHGLFLMVAILRKSHLRQCLGKL
ncbi:hypothetical protein E4U61_007992 [Claviceps capensis]|nr:hypothetical protein E4U61_007992 [Claviceps capensis]